MAVKKEPCPKCGSKDNLARYPDGHASCFTPDCTYYEKASGDSMPAFDRTTKRLEMSGVVTSLDARGISKETCRRFGVTASFATSGDVDTHYYPYYSVESKEITAAKKRRCATKDFSWSGTRENIGLFGQNTCRGSGKYITITEGELDALSVAQMFGNKYDVVSLRDGAGSATRDVKDQLEFLEGYDNIVLCFDQDDAGRKAVDAVKDLLSPNKVSIVTLGAKDANALLKEGKTKEFIKSWWDAKKYSPAGIVAIKETWDAILEYKNTPSTPYPWKGLNDYLLGQRAQEIVIWAADTGIGKSQTMREIQHHIISTTEDRVGCLMLEESVAKTTLGWMSFAAGRPLHKELDTVTEEDLRRYWEQATKDDKLVLLDHRGWANSIDTLKARIRYMAKSLGCHFIVLDHLHIALSSIAGASGDWSGIDELMTEFRTLVHELDICLHLVSHTSADRSLRGSKGISKLADTVIFLERDKHHEDPEIANTTAVVVDKNRFVGDVGTACYLKYDSFTGRMLECEAPQSTPTEF